MSMRSPIGGWLLALVEFANRRPSHGDGTAVVVIRKLLLMRTKLAEIWRRDSYLVDDCFLGMCVPGSIENCTITQLAPLCSIAMKHGNPLPKCL